ncbi:MAG: S-layer homology domain-containing protein [Treponema sp.]|nr:S-layer homology domain-containing protein [Treponema sp.]
MKKYLFCLLFPLALFSACTTTKDILIDSHTSQADVKLTEIEAAIVPLEATAGASLSAADARTRTGRITSARQMLTQMEREASADADYSGKLLAWSGRLAILEGRYSEALRLHRQSNVVSPGNFPAIILSIRLEGDPSKRLEIIQRELSLINPRVSGAGELHIERGRALLALNRFSESAGAFDTAFSSGLERVYSDSYSADRNRAWELRNTSGVAAGSLGLLGRDSITWNDCIALARNETQLLRFITGGRTIADNELFNRLVDRAFIPFSQDVNVMQWSAARPRADETVTRAGAAWLVWHLYAESRADRGMLSRYSARFATGANPRSPIADIPPLSPFFDSILGCVETEFMSLQDGRNFRPSQPMRGAELLSILRRIDD